jgi:hypothetical protein
LHLSARWRGTSRDAEVERATDSPAARTAAQALALFARSDDMPRLVVTPGLLAEVRREDHVELRFRAPASVSIPARQATVRAATVLVALGPKRSSGRLTSFYQDADRGEWFALVWAQPSADARGALEAALTTFTSRQSP